MANIIDDIVVCDALLNCQELNDFYEYDMENEAFLEALGKVTQFEVIVFGKKNEFSQESLEQLNILLSQMHSLKSLIFNNMRKDKILNIKSIFDNINSNIERLYITGCDIADGISEEIENKFENLIAFSIQKTAISKIPTFCNKDCKIYMGREISGITDSEYIEYALNNEIANKLIITTDSTLKQILNTIYIKSPLPLGLYEKNVEVLSAINEDICICIDNVNELDSEKIAELRKDKRIKNITINGGEFKVDDKNNWYSIEEYALARKEIDKIVDSVILPNEDEPDKEKKIFAQVYKILGERIIYDYYAISGEGKKDEKLKYDCRNLKNGLTGIERDGKKECLAVCAGYAEILRNVLSCFGIESRYIKSYSQPVYVQENSSYRVKINEKGEIIRRNGTDDIKGHAYNLVELDGKKFYCDLTWDNNNIKAGRYPLKNFLVSYEEFMKSHADVGFDNFLADRNANISFSLEDQMSLFGALVKGDICEMMQENYLSGFVSQYLDMVQQTGKIIDSKGFLDAMSLVKQVENAIITRGGNKKNNIAVKVGDNKFVFETSNKEEYDKLKKQIKTRSDRKSGYQSR